MRAPTLEDWSLYDEHLDEAAFAWRTWRSAMHAPHYSLADVETGPEERLFAHVDALVIGGDAVAQRMLVPALDAAEPDIAAAAALALLASDSSFALFRRMIAQGRAFQGASRDAGRVDPLSSRAKRPGKRGTSEGRRKRAKLESEHSDYLERILEILQSGHDNAEAIGRALARDRQAVHAKRLAHAWERANDRVRAWLFEPLAAMMSPAWFAEQFATCAASAHAPLAKLALRQVWLAPDPAHEPIVRAMLRSSTHAVQRAAIVAALVIGLPEAWQLCRAAARSDRDLLALQCAAGSRDLAYERFDAGERSNDLLWALGFAGTHDAAARLVSCLDEAEHAALAGDSLALITGLRIEAGLSRAREPEPAVADDDPPPRLEAQDFLPVPDAAAVRRAWTEIAPRFAHGVRYALGVPADSAGLRSAMERCGSWRREVFAIALALSQQTGLPVDPNDWAHVQRGRLRATTARAPAPSHEADPRAAL